MAELPKDRLQDLCARIDQQRNTVEALKRDGHEYVDAERQLRNMLAEFATRGREHTGI
jgi:hypothetical protein